MIRTSLALLLSATLALPHMTTPAQADARDYAHRHGANGPLHSPVAPQQSLQDGNGVGTAIAVLGGLAIAAALAKRAQERDEERDAARREAARQQHLERPRQTWDDRHQTRRDHRDDWRDRSHPSRGHGSQRHREVARVLPEYCFRRGVGRDGPWRGYTAGCMHDHFGSSAALPRSCLRTVRTDRGSWPLYSGRCLRQAGWESAYARDRD